ncbi:MAG: hypothetical protein ACAH17_02865, partial [Candidatus Paceibacterota bacterium]
MPEFKENYSFVCDHASMSQNRKINAMGLFEHVSQDFPLDPWYVVTSFNSEDKPNLKLKIKLLKGEEVVQDNFFGKILDLDPTKLVNYSLTVFLKLP